MYRHGRAAALTLKWDRESRWGPHSEPLLNADGLSGMCAWNVQHTLLIATQTQSKRVRDFADQRTTQPVFI